jgi:rhodanese-related sulfurtransferase
LRSERFLGQAVALLVGSAALAAVSNAFAGPERKLLWVGSYRDAPARPATGPTPAVAPPASVTPASEQTFPPHPDKAYVEVGGDDVAALFARKNVLFLDARRSSVYREGHVAGARSISVWEADVDQKVKALFAEGLDQSAPVVVYCSGGDCEDSHILAEKLYRVGFDNLLVYKDGFPDWQRRDLAITRGSQP